MTDIKEPINTTSDGTFLSVVCENPEKSVVGQKLGGPQPPQHPQELPPAYMRKTRKQRLCLAIDSRVTVSMVSQYAVFTKYIWYCDLLNLGVLLRLLKKQSWM